MFMGLNSASACFQRELGKKLVGLEGAIHVSDDILIHGSILNHDERLSKALDRLQEIGATAGIDKCKIRRKKIKILRNDVLR